MPKVPHIRKSLEYMVTLKNGTVIKKPNPGFGFKVKSDVDKFKRLGTLAPKTTYRESENVIVQKAIKGRFARPKEMTKIGREVCKKGLVPRGLLEHDVIVTSKSKAKRLKFKIVDVGHFEYRKKGQKCR